MKPPARETISIIAQHIINELASELTSNSLTHEQRLSAQQAAEQFGALNSRSHGGINSYNDTAYQDRYQDTAYDDHYADAPSYRDAAR